MKIRPKYLRYIGIYFIDPNKIFPLEIELKISVDGVSYLIIGRFKLKMQNKLHILVIRPSIELKLIQNLNIEFFKHDNLTSIMINKVYLFNKPPQNTVINESLGEFEYDIKSNKQEATFYDYQSACFEGIQPVIPSRINHSIKCLEINSALTDKFCLEEK